LQSIKIRDLTPEMSTLLIHQCQINATRPGSQSPGPHFLISLDIDGFHITNDEFVHLISHLPPIPAFSVHDYPHPIHQSIMDAMAPHWPRLRSWEIGCGIIIINIINNNINNNNNNINFECLLSKIRSGI